VSKKLLETWAQEMAGKYTLIEGQEELESSTGQGRARYSSLTLERILNGEAIDTPQLLLIRPGESREDAASRFLTEIKHPLVRHRLAMFRGLLLELIEQWGKPDLTVVEAIRSLAMGKKTKAKYLKELKEKRDDREHAYKELRKEKQSTSKQAILRYRLWRETNSFCPFCGKPIDQAAIHNGDADISHIYPRSRIECNEFFNLTIAHAHCNRMEMENKIPRLAFADCWPEIEARARSYFKRPDQQRKLQLFLCETNEEAEKLVASKSSLVQTAYIAKMIRRLCLIELGWTGADGRDPSDALGNIPSRAFAATNGALTSRLREAWGLDEILHPKAPVYSDEHWATLTDEQKAEHKATVKGRFAKNRGDLRHHAIDAMVISCTLPWFAYRVVDVRDTETDEPAWWQLDGSTRRVRALHPLYGDSGQFKRHVTDWIARLDIRHHVSRSRHQRAYDTTIYGRPKKKDRSGKLVPIPDCYVSREPITSLKPDDLKSPRTYKTKVYPQELGDYLATAWENFCRDEPNWEKQLKENDDRLPEAFQKRLCFSAFQRWRESDRESFVWPETVKIPIKRVGYIGVEDDNAVAPASPGTHGYVARGSFREVRLHPSEDGKTIVPVFVPFWRLDKPIPKSPIKESSKPVATIFRGQLLRIINSPGRNTPVGLYRVASTMQKNIQLLPVHLADRKDSLKASGFLENGVNVSWDTFIKAAGYELPHPPSAQSQSAGAAEA
jgi:hypothetical protein